METTMPALLPDAYMGVLSLELVLSALSITMTAYFWMVRARRERPCLTVFQLRDFRPTMRRGNAERKTKELALSQTDLGGVLIANNSTRQNAIVRFDCFLRNNGHTIKGHWGYLNEERFPWNIPPESAKAVSLACFFEVPEDFEPPENMPFRVELITVNGQRFSHRFTMRAPEL